MQILRRDKTVQTVNEIERLRAALGALPPKHPALIEAEDAHAAAEARVYELRDREKAANAAALRNGDPGSPTHLMVKLAAQVAEAEADRNRATALIEAERKVYADVWMRHLGAHVAAYELAVQQLVEQLGELADIGISATRHAADNKLPVLNRIHASLVLDDAVRLARRAMV